MPTWLLGLIAFVIFFVVVYLAFAIKILREYERAVQFRLGRFIGVKGPGIFLIIPLVDKLAKVDLRIMDLDVPKQKVITKDNVSTDVDAVVYMRVLNPEYAILRVEQYYRATSRLAQTTLRDVLGQIELDDLLTQREELSERIRKILDEATDPWGLKVTNVTIRDVMLPDEMVRAIAKQAEAERERRSRIIMAEGEYQASKRMSEAAMLYEEKTAGLRLRELQTLVEIAREGNLVVVTPSQIGGRTGEVAGLVNALGKWQKGKKTKK
jgi:regulator of protease activity HflC (stomatin/prohibitin superfamily)